MKVASISEVKNKLSAFIDRVKAGESILILERGRPVARLEPVGAADEPDEGRLARLERAGLVRRGKRRRGPDPILLKPPPRLRKPVDVVAMLIEERREGR